MASHGTTCTRDIRHERQKGHCKVLVLPGQGGTGLSLERSSKQRGGTGHTRDRCKAPCSIFYTAALQQSTTSQGAEPRPRGHTGCRGSRCCPVWSPFAGVWCPAAQQTSFLSPCPGLILSALFPALPEEAGGSNGLGC